MTHKQGGGGGIGVSYVPAFFSLSRMSLPYARVQIQIRFAFLLPRSVDLNLGKKNGLALYVRRSVRAAELQIRAAREECFSDSPSCSILSFKNFDFRYTDMLQLSRFCTFSFNLGVLAI